MYVAESDYITEVSGTEEESKDEVARSAQIFKILYSFVKWLISSKHEDCLETKTFITECTYEVYKVVE
jgi:hypothetical protein